MTNARAVDSFTEIATLRITLKDSDPPIWREVEVPTSITLKVLHDIVQVGGVSLMRNVLCRSKVPLPAQPLRP